MTGQPSRTDVLATLNPRPARRWVAVVLQAALALLVMSLGVSILPQAPLPGGALLIVGGAVFWGAVRLYRATQAQVLLTREELTDSDGRLLARIEEIREIDRGVFAFKPSNGFLLHLYRPAGRVWVPGLWWRVGRFVGVGGVTSANEGKAMAELISMLILEAEADPSKRR